MGSTIYQPSALLEHRLVRDAFNYAKHVFDTFDEYTVGDDLLDLLEEYGEELDLPEGWWMDFGDAEDMQKAFITFKHQAQ